jgi:hypothetical protein
MAKYPYVGFALLGNAHYESAGWVRLPDCLEYWVTPALAVGVFLVCESVETAPAVISSEIIKACVSFL